jgi:hypothetical protein
VCAMQLRYLCNWCGGRNNCAAPGVPTVDRIGRHNLLAFGQLLGGGACIGCALVNDGTAQAILAGIGKFACSGEMGRLAVLIVMIHCLDSEVGRLAVLIVTIHCVASHASRLVQTQHCSCRLQASSLQCSGPGHDAVPARLYLLHAWWCHVSHQQAPPWTGAP